VDSGEGRVKTSKMGLTDRLAYTDRIQHPPVLDDILMHVYPDLPFSPLQQPTACIVARVENGLRKLPQGMVEPAH